MKPASRIKTASELMNATGRQIIELGGVDINLKLTKAEGADTLLIGFHGAIDRKLRKLPVYTDPIPEVENHAHQLMISDPSLELGEELSMAWYAGDHRFDAQALLGELFREAAEVLGVRKVIYFGSSGGGFAALYYSWIHPGSLALVGNAQTNLEKYYPRHIARYLESCWPTAKDISALDEKIVTDVCALYAKNVPNYVIYCQNPTDTFHMFNHCTPFIAGIESAADRKRVVFECTYPGRTGHGPVWSVFSPWLRAAVAAPSWDAVELIETKYRLHPGSAPPPARLRGKDLKSVSFSESDIAFGKLLRDHTLRGAKKEASNG
ncbi:hypothetical protein [Paracoccus sediminicola]|uniref:hypothetical protein n=1 Tax=Paracoccus sediminicola TaxID=3017783 RepID=UPI0022F07E97|nr:hypothetical protein [Paracoccus sediminicola]WBU55514.1 hypothetical protein PAF18_08210 [Paracoccus sediminicola]